MSDWRDVMETRREAEAQRAAADRGGLSDDTRALIAQLEAVRLELRALGTTLDYAVGKVAS